LKSSKPDPVTGEVSYYSASQNRGEGGAWPDRLFWSAADKAAYCGPEGRHWEAVPTEPVEELPRVEVEKLRSILQDEMQLTEEETNEIVGRVFEVSDATVHV